jgi:hypothetical protein
MTARGVRSEQTGPGSMVLAMRSLSVLRCWTEGKGSQCTAAGGDGREQRRGAVARGRTRACGPSILFPLEYVRMRVGFAHGAFD